MGIPERVPVLWTVPISWILEEKLVGSWVAALSSKTKEGSQKETQPQQGKPDHNEESTRTRDTTEHPKAFLSLLGNVIQ